MAEIDDIVKAIQVLKVTKGDAIILKTDMRLSINAYTNLTNLMQAQLNKMGFQQNNIPILIFEEGMDIEILRLTKKK